MECKHFNLVFLANSEREATNNVRESIQAPASAVPSVLVGGGRSFCSAKDLARRLSYSHKAHYEARGFRDVDRLLPPLHRVVLSS